MTSRPRTTTRRPISAAEVAAMAGIGLDQHPLESDGHRIVRVAWCVILFFGLWLVIGAALMR
jgi:hypothetical protein